MGRRKTAEEYGEEITSLHYRLEDLERRGKQDGDQYAELVDKLRDRRAKWAERLQITVHVANNEQKPWTADLIQYTTATETITVDTQPMPPKSKTGYDQTGDYNFFIETYQKWGGMVAERKTATDLYGTLFSRDENRNWQRARFAREVDRFQADERFNRFAVFAECNLFDFLSYVPRFHPETKKYNAAREDPVNTTQKRAAIAALAVKGTPVLWCGSRKAAALLYAHMIRAWCRDNYGHILGLRPAELGGHTPNGDGREQ